MDKIPKPKPESGVCSCKMMGDCPISNLVMARDGFKTNALCTANELREWIKSLITGQELVSWMKRAEDAE